MSRIQMLAPPLTWSPWREVWAQFGVVGRDSDNHRTVVNVSYTTRSRAKSTFDVEIRSGNETFRTFGPGSHRVVILGNVATSISVRLRSHTLGQDVFVEAR